MEDSCRSGKEQMSREDEKEKNNEQSCGRCPEETATLGWK